MRNLTPLATAKVANTPISEVLKIQRNTAIYERKVRNFRCNTDIFFCLFLVGLTARG